MPHRIILCGGNGAGKSTLGKLLGQALGWQFRDIEDYYFPADKGEYKYADARSKAEVARLLAEDLRRHEHFILASVRGDYGREVTDLLTCAVRIDVPRETRLRRVRERSLEKFGARMLPGGDLYQSEQKFFDMVSSRPESYVTDWLQTLSIPVIPIDGTRPPEENVRLVTNLLMK